MSPVEPEPLIFIDSDIEFIESELSKDTEVSPGLHEMLKRKSALSSDLERDVFDSMG